MANRRNTSIVEDCLKVIYTVGEWDPRARTITEIAAQLGSSTSNASTLVRRLGEEGLVAHERYGDVSLTPAGLATALRMVRRHRLIETFLVEVLDYGWDEVHDEAEVLEHTISDHMLERIDTRLGQPWRDPHGDAIPTEAGVVHRPVARPLEALDPGESGYVVRILDESAAMLRWFEEEGLALDTPVRVRERRPFAGAVVVEVGDRASARAVDVGLQAVGALWVGPALPLEAADPASGCHYPDCDDLTAQEQPPREF